MSKTMKIGSYLGGSLGLYAGLDVWQADIARAKAAGITLARFNCDAWDFLEPSRGQFNPAPLDAIVSLLQAAGMQIIFTIPISASWNRAMGTDTHTPTTNMQDVATFCGAIAARYASSIQYFEVWNEPDNPDFWKPSPNASAYVAFLKTAYQALKQGNPNAVVMMGGLAAPELKTFWNSFVRYGGLSYTDVINIHVYPASGTIDQAVNVVRGHSKQIWITETSNTGAYFSDDNTAYWEQDKYFCLIANLYLAWQYTDVDAVIWHTLRNCGIDGGQPKDFQFGLMRADGTPLPAYSALSAFTQWSALVP